MANVIHQCNKTEKFMVTQLNSMSLPFFPAAEVTADRFVFAASDGRRD